MEEIKKIMYFKIKKLEQKHRSVLFQRSYIANP